MKPMTCEEAMQRLFAYLDRALSGEPLEDFEVHLKECLACCDKLAFSRQLDDFVKGRLPETSVPPRLQDRIRNALERN